MLYKAGLKQGIYLRVRFEIGFYQFKRVRGNHILSLKWGKGLGIRPHIPPNFHHFFIVIEKKVNKSPSQIMFMVELMLMQV